MFCSNVECCNVATCQFSEKPCKVGYWGKAHTHIPTYDPNSAGKLFLVKDIGLWQTSKYINNDSKQTLFFWLIKVPWFKLFHFISCLSFKNGKEPFSRPIQTGILKQRLWNVMDPCQDGVAALYRNICL